ncbi:stage II sporulation protein P [Anaerolentibacter hominis]|uniref:stage II sporulation protein P n=1 Tax=Anaerolentibacter hominis TaxID=3079009 RepID=UPI0031B7EEC7
MDLRMAGKRIRIRKEAWIRLAVLLITALFLLLCGSRIGKACLTGFCEAAYREAGGIMTYQSRYAQEQKLGSGLLGQIVGNFSINRYFMEYADIEPVEEDESTFLLLEELPGFQNDRTEVSYIFGETYYEESKDTQDGNDSKLAANRKVVETLKKNKDYEYLLSNFYILDSVTSVNEKVLPVKTMLSKDMTLKQSDQPQILIYHTHGSETFADSKKGKTEDTVIGLGDTLTAELEKYGYNVIHDRNVYDEVDGVLDRSKAYTYSLEAVNRHLKENPSIQVVLDIHRDGVAGDEKTYTTIDGEKSARIMFFNGLSRNKKGPIDYLNNPNRTGNLAFSLQMECKAMEEFPDFVKKIYLKNYRYNLHVRERCLLVEVGNQNNTVREGKNAMIHLAYLLNEVLQ